MGIEYETMIGNILEIPNQIKKKEMEIKRCVSCNKELSSKYNFCPDCGDTYYLDTKEEVEEIHIYEAVDPDFLHDNFHVRIPNYQEASTFIGSYDEEVTLLTESHDAFEFHRIPKQNKESHCFWREVTKKLDEVGMKYNILYGMVHISR